MNDHEFLSAFENGTLPHDQFPHQAHVRMAWLYLRSNEWESGLQKICGGIQRFALAHGATHKYHETITVFWARMVKHAITCTPDIADFAQFTAAHPQILDGRFMRRFYSAALLRTDMSRHIWVEPDLEPMPSDCGNSGKTSSSLPER